MTRHSAILTPMPTGSRSYDIIMLVLDDVAHDRRVRAEAIALADAGWRVLIIGTQRANSPLSERESWNGVDLWRVRYSAWGTGLWRPWRWVRHGLQAVQLVHALRRVSGRVWHAHDLPALLIMGLARGFASKYVRPILVYDSHELYLYMRVRGMLSCWHTITRPLFWALEGWLARQCAAVITVSDTNARMLRRWHRLRSVVVVRNAVDPPSQMAEDGASPIGQIKTRGRSCLVHSGHVTNYGRALDELVSALVFVPETVHLVFLGEGEHVAALAAQAREIGVGERVHMVAPVAPDAVASVLRPADAAVVLRRLTTWHDRATLPVKLFEAVAAGLPVVASDGGDLGRMVRRYGLGELCDPSDPRAIAAAVGRILAPDTQRAIRMRVGVVQAELNWQQEKQRLIAVYRELLA